jgi:predicted RNA polymerase sigma factor
VLLPEHDRSLWDHAQIERGMAALYRAQKLGLLPAQRAVTVDPMEALREE